MIAKIEIADAAPGLRHSRAPLRSGRGSDLIAMPRVCCNRDMFTKASSPPPSPPEEERENFFSRIVKLLLLHNTSLRFISAVVGLGYILSATRMNALEVGVASCDITPDVTSHKVPLAGYGARKGKPSTGV